VAITFSPDHERIWPYSQEIDVFVAGQEQSSILTLTGRCWRRQLFLTTTDPSDDSPARVPPATEDHFSLPTTMEALENQITTSLGVTKKPQYDISLKFPRGDGGSPMMRKLVVGSASVGLPGGAMGGTFEIEMGEEAKRTGYFSVSPEKGPVPPDARVEVVFTYKPSPPNHQGGLTVGQWVKYPVRIHLKGGIKSASDPDLQSITINLEAFVFV